MSIQEALCLVLAGILDACLLYSESGCRQYTEGTDMYYQCTTGEEIDLGIQDEADSPTSKGRE